MILSDFEIKEALQSGELKIEGFDPLYIGPSSVDFHLDNVYKEGVLPIATSVSYLDQEEQVRRTLFKEFEDLDTRHVLLEMRNKGVRFVVEVPKIELD